MELVAAQFEVENLGQERAWQVLMAQNFRGREPQGWGPMVLLRLVLAALVLVESILNQLILN